MYHQRQGSQSSLLYYLILYKLLCLLNPAILSHPFYNDYLVLHKKLCKMSKEGLKKHMYRLLAHHKSTISSDVTFVIAIWNAMVGPSWRPLVVINGVIGISTSVYSLSNHLNSVKNWQNDTQTIYWTWQTFNISINSFLEQLLKISSSLSGDITVCEGTKHQRLNQSICICIVKFHTAKHTHDWKESRFTHLFCC